MKTVHMTLLTASLLAATLTGLACSGSNPVEEPPADATPDFLDDLEEVLPPLEPGDWSEFDGGVNPFLPPDLTQERSAQGLVSGSRTLNGAVTTHPSYAEPPFVASNSANAGDVAVVQVKAVASPSASNSPRVRFQSNTASYGYLQIPTNNELAIVPLHMANAQTLDLKLFNSATDTSARYNEAVTWSYWVNTYPINDGLEPNDDENTSTVADRTMAEAVPLTRQINRSMYQLMGAPTADREDWYSYPMTGGSTYRFVIATTNSTQRRWTYSFRLYDSAGSLVASYLDYAGVNLGWNVAVPTTGTHYLQVVGVPLTTRGASMYYAQYSVKSYLLSSCSVPSLTDFDVTEPTALEAATFSATNAGGPATSWSWNFGGGATPNTSSDASPAVTLGAPGTYSASVTATNACGNDTLNFSLVVAPKLIGLELTVFQGPGGVNPSLFWNLANWNVATVRDWVDDRINPVFAATGFQFDPAQVTVNFVADHPEWYVLDTSTEFNNCSAYVEQNDRTLHLGIIEDQTYSGWAGIAWASFCSGTNNGRACLVVSMTSSFMVTAVAHELGHVMNLPHIRTNTNPLTELNYNLMSYGTTNTSLSSNIDREDASGCWLSNDDPMNQVAITHMWVRTYLDWV